MITETRKHIIEIIEPYMDKALVKGCLISVVEEKFKTNISYEKVKLDVIYEIEWIPGMGIRTYGVSCNKFFKKREEFKILGHYDITSVLKFIYINTNTYDNIYYSLTAIHIGINSKGEYKSYTLDLKPLHLYTEQEEKDLLELLQNLGRYCKFCVF